MARSPEQKMQDLEIQVAAQADALVEVYGALKELVKTAPPDDLATVVATQVVKRFQNFTARRALELIAKADTLEQAQSVARTALRNEE